MSYWNGTTWVEPRASIPRRDSRATRWGATVVMIIAAGLLVLPFGAASARQSSGTPWIELASVNGRAASVQPSLGNTVTFATGYASNVKNPRIEVLCYQSGDLVYGEAGGVNDTFQLGGGASTWLSTGGAADCTANLFYFGWHAGTQTYNRLASTTFSAGG
jgi:hypothetical protein